MSRLLRETGGAFAAVIAFTLVLGLAFPLAMTGVAQVVFPNRADGSRVTVDGKVVGSRLIAKAWTVDTGRRDSDGNPVTAPDKRYFQPRPSQTGYSATATFFANRGPASAAARDFYRDGIKAYLALERPYDGGLTVADVPQDAVTDSGSGVDPHISPANARIQAARIAAVRRLPLARVRALIHDHTTGRFLGLYGDPGVNVLELNLALDKET